MKFRVIHDSLDTSDETRQVVILLPFDDGERIVVTKNQLFGKWCKAWMNVYGGFWEEQGNELLIGITIARQIMRQLDINPDLQEIEI